MTGFIKRQGAEFSDKLVLKTLYVSLVRSNLEYCSPVWSPYHVGWNKQLEKVQYKFLRFVFKDVESDYLNMCKQLNLDPLNVRRRLSSIMMCYNLLANNYDSPEILNKLNINCPSRDLRHNNIFKLDKHTTDYAEHEPINEMMKNFSTVGHLFDYDRNNQVLSRNFKATCLKFLMSAISLRDNILYSSLGS